MNSISPDTPLKQCTKCKNWKPSTSEYFHAMHTVKSGLRSICKVCQKAYDATRASIKNERKKARIRTDPEFAELTRERARQYIKHYPDAVSERKKTYYAAHPEQRRVEAHNRRARERAVGGTYTAQDIQDQLKRQKHKCYYCKQKVNKSYHVDHVIPIVRNGSNTKDNIVITCPLCNESKHARLPHEWPEGGRLL